MTAPGFDGPRPGVPMPGQHLAAQVRPEAADPARISAEIDSLLAELEARPDAYDSAETGVDITRRARILEQAHEVLVQALATVDKI
ncbi:hypothetical protein [Nocardia sp. XZ_19_385]|uniref:hypothetical protein n=1 Tax=Nocardia sp. XZ_19_385 TaxID=2769488 RepID=UPI00188F53E9|nr:hypothetical protein [Nocardia sp. XZ_19_385]